jgi:uncharacterized membrane protein YozB (DUF420 family)
MTKTIGELPSENCDGGFADNRRRTSLSILGTQADFGCDVNLLLQLGLLGFIGVGFVLARRGDIRHHRGIMTAAILSNFAGFLYVMAPSFWGTVTSPVDFTSLWTGTTLPHATIGISALFLGSLFAVGKLPRRNLKSWMQTTYGLWLVNIALGLSLYLQMAKLF